MMRSLNHLLVCGAAAGAIALGLVGCDEPAYEQTPAPPQAATPEPETPVGSGGTRSGTAYGAAMKAGHRTADRVEDHQQRLLDEMEDN